MCTCIPKPVINNIIEELKRRGLPYKAEVKEGCVIACNEFDVHALTDEV